MKHHYLNKIERELSRLWINQYSIVVTELGKDKFFMSDGKRGFESKGHLIFDRMRKIPDRAGYSKFWDGVRDLERVYKGKGKRKNIRR